MGEILGTIYGRLLMLLALIAIAVLTLVALRQDRAAAQASDLMLVMTNARQAFTNSPSGYANFSNGNLATLVSTGVIPPRMVRNGKLVDRWGKDMALDYTWDSTHGTQGRITFGGGESTEECVKLVSSLTDFDKLIVNALAFDQNALPNSTPYSTHLVANYCAQSAPQGANISVTFS
ncbi:hypothetical protein [Burkholderia gladioli]|uniref:hypothetical protein n=1 Tax=Burkholderia gladioli TaxID=28095 RepID=UPI0034DB4E89